MAINRDKKVNKVVYEPIKHYFERYGVDISNIKKIVCGQKYSAVMLKNGNIGVCANLLNPVNVRPEDFKEPDLNNIEHRIILNAYFNARLNYSNTYEKTVDVFDGFDYSHYKNITMIGLFKPLLKKFNENNIKINVFDMIKKSAVLISLKNELEYIKRADVIILSSTSISNGTFVEIVNNTGENCDIFLLGPSSIMNKDIFKYKNIKRIFGSVFEKNDETVLNIIKKGYGTRRFLPFGKKECLLYEFI